MRADNINKVLASTPFVLASISATTVMLWMGVWVATDPLLKIVCGVLGLMNVGLLCYMAVRRLRRTHVPNG